jgi:hypothetical protein
MRPVWTCLTCFILLATAAAAQEYFVATDGDDANPGTLEKPLKSPVKAAARLGPGDTLTFRAGEYKCVTDGTLGIGPARSGEEGKPITFRTHQNEPVKIDCDGSDWGFSPNGRSWIVIDGFEIVNKGGYAMKISAQHGNGKETGSHVTVRNCELHDTGNECLFAFKTPWLLIENCYVHDSARSHGIYINQGCHNLIVRNVTSENNRGNSAIRINASGGGTKDALIERCIMRGCALASSFMGAINCTYRQNLLFNNGFDGPRSSGYREINMRNGDELGGKGTACENDLFENNTIVNLLPEGHKLNQLIHILPETKNVTFRNNILVMKGRPIFTLDFFEGFGFENNCLYRIGGGEEVNKGGSLADFCKAKGLKESGNISKDPMFVDADKGDLHLKDGSPCLGAGLPKDKDGKARDIGVYQRGEEFQLGCKLPWKKAETK